VRGCPVTLTTEDMGRLRVPLAALPGLDVRGLLLWPTREELHRRDLAMFRTFSDGSAAGAQLPTGIEWIGVTRDTSDHALAGYVVTHTDFASRHGIVANFRGGPVDVDLADAATRDRVARWLAARVGLNTSGRCPWWFTLAPVASRPGWGLAYGPHGSYETFGPGRETEVPALVGLNGADDRRLPDGSRYVDALALALVAVGAP
jgi:hypothetical protein